MANISFDKFGNLWAMSSIDLQEIWKISISIKFQSFGIWVMKDASDGLPCLQDIAHSAHSWKLIAVLGALQLMIMICYPKMQALMME